MNILLFHLSCIVEYKYPPNPITNDAFGVVDQKIENHTEIRISNGQIFAVASFGEPQNVLNYTHIHYHSPQTPMSLISVIEYVLNEVWLL